jgi:hypothetical protein
MPEQSAMSVHVCVHSIIHSTNLYQVLAAKVRTGDPVLLSSVRAGQSVLAHLGDGPSHLACSSELYLRGGSEASQISHAG